MDCFLAWARPACQIHRGIESVDPALLVGQAIPPPAFGQRVAAALQFPRAPPGHHRFHLPPAQAPSTPGLRPLAPIILSVPFLVSLQRQFPAHVILRHGAKMMHERTPRRPQGKPRLPGPVKEVLILELPEPEILVEQSHSVKNPPPDQKTDTMRHAGTC